MQMFGFLKAVLTIDLVLNKTVDTFGLSNEPKRAMCFKNLCNKILPFRNFPTQYIWQFLTEMHKLYMCWLHAFQFILRKVSVDAFVSQIPNCYICVFFISDANFAAWYWQFLIMYLPCFIGG